MKRLTREFVTSIGAKIAEKQYNWIGIPGAEKLDVFCS